MTTYLINHLRIPNDAPNEEGLKYLEQVEATARPYGGKWLAMDAEVQVLEGAWPGSAVLMEFPSTAEARNWYNSPEYRRIIPLRTDHSISDMILIDAVAPDFTVAGFAQAVRAMISGAAAPGG